ncbi:MAG: tyrosine-type recombinase/integrase [Waltera sp.]
MKSSTYEKPISAELAQLIRMAITYTREKYGKTKYIFVNDKDPAKALQYGTIQSRIVKMIHEKDIRDDNGNLFGFGSHLYRHYYSVKLSEMHLDDWTIAQLLGHRSVRNVKYYRKMSNQALADDTREVLKMLSDQMKESLDGWEEEYEQIRQNGGM